MGKKFAEYSKFDLSEINIIPVIVLAGSIENLPELNKAGFKGIFSIAPGPITLEKALSTYCTLSTNQALPYAYGFTLYQSLKGR